MSLYSIIKKKDDQVVKEGVSAQYTLLQYLFDHVHNKVFAGDYTVHRNYPYPDRIYRLELEYTKNIGKWMSQAFKASGYSWLKCLEDKLTEKLSQKGLLLEDLVLPTSEENRSYINISLMEGWEE